MIDNKSNIKGTVLVVTSAVLWAISGNVGSFLFKNKEVNPNHITMYRLIFGGLILLVYNCLTNRDKLFSIFHKTTDRIRLIYFAFFGLLAMQYGYFSAIRHSNASTATILQSLAPFIIVIIISIIDKKAPSNIISLALLINFVGAFLLITHGRLDRIVVSKAAIFFGILSAFGKVNYDLTPGPLQTKYNTIIIMGWAMLISGVGFTILFQPWKTSFIIDSVSLLGMFFVIIFGTVLPLLFYLEGLKIIGAQRASIISLVEPVFATVIAVLFMNAKLLKIDYLGVTMIMSGLVLLVLPDKENKN